MVKSCYCQLIDGTIILICLNFLTGGAASVVTSSKMYMLRYQAAKFDGVQLASHEISSVLQCAAICKDLGCQSFNFGCRTDISSGCLCQIYENVAPTLEASSFETSEYLNYFEMSCPERFKCRIGQCMEDAFCGLHSLSRETYKSGNFRKLSYCGWCRKPFMTTRKTWTEAVTDCTTDDGILTEPRTDEESDILYNLTKTYNETIWIGVNGLGAKWNWQDGSTVNHTYWMSGDPNESGSVACVIAFQPSSPRSFWRDRVCDEKHFYFCDYSKHCFVVT